MGEDRTAAFNGVDESQGPIPPVPPEIPIGLPSELLRLAAKLIRRARAAACRRRRRRIGVRKSGSAAQSSASPRLWVLTPRAPRRCSTGPAEVLGSFRPASVGQSLMQVEFISTSKVKDEQPATGIGELSTDGAERRHGRMWKILSAPIALSSSATRRWLDASAAVTSDGRSGSNSSTIRASPISSRCWMPKPRRVRTAEVAVAQSERNISTVLIALYKALGGGWEVALPEPRND